MGGALILTMLPAVRLAMEEPLLERELELGTLSAWLAGVCSGRGGRLVVEGPAGIGKSSLLSALGERALASGMVLMHAEASEIASQVAFGVARAALGARWPRDHRRSRRLDEGRRVAGDAVRRAVRVTLELAERQPVLVSIDDALWADAASVRWLAQLAAAAPSSPIGVALTTRSGGTELERSILGVLLDERGAIIVRPAPLSRPATERLVCRWLDSSPGEEMVAACHAETGGNPYLLRALCDALRQASVTDAPAAVRAIGSRAIARTVGRRLERLAPPERALIEAVAVVGEIGGVAELAGIIEVSAAEAERATGRLTDLGLLREAIKPEVVHPLVASAVRAEVPALRREQLARRAADRLHAAGRIEEAAARLVDLQPRGDVVLCEWLCEAAASAAAQGAPDVGANLLRRAIAEPPPPARRPAVLAALGTMLLANGDPDAPRILRRALDDTPAGGEAASIAMVLARALNYARRTEEAVAVLDRARAGLASSDEALSEELEAMTMHYLSFGPERRPERARRLERLSDRRGTSELAYRMRLAELAADSICAGRPGTDSAVLAERALAGGLLLSRDQLTFYKAVVALAYAGRPAAARVQLRDALTHARRRGDTAQMGFALTLSGEVRRVEGEMAAAEADTRRGFELLPPGELGQRFALRALIESLVEQDRIADAEEELRGGGLTGPLPPMLPTLGLLHARASVRLASGTPSLALEDLLHVGELAAQLEFRDPVTVPWRLTASEALSALDRREDARPLVAEHMELARRTALPEAIGATLRVEGVLIGGRAGRQALAEAVRLLEGGFAQLELARALVDLGAACRRDLPGQARAALERGMTLAGRLAAVRLAGRARAVIGAGEDDAGVASADPPIGEYHAMRREAVISPRELEVLRMLRGSLSMREICSELHVSRNTLKTHCRSLYRKLDASSRVQAVQRGRALGLLR